METTKERNDLQAMVLEDITQYLRDRYVASFEKTDDTTLEIRFVGSRKLRLTLQGATQ